MDIAGKARQLERRLTRTMNAAVGELVGRSEAGPLEIVHGVLERAEQRIQDIGRGRRLFPFNRVRLLVVAPPRDREARARIAAVLEGPPSLADRLTDRLKAAGCQTVTLQTQVEFVRQRSAEWEAPEYHVEFDRVDAAPAPEPEPPSPAAGPARMKLAVLQGTAGQQGYVFKGGRIDIGRRAEVLDQKQRLVRTNHVAFAEEGPDANRSVSRRHAHIEYSDDERCYRLWDDRSAHGTSIVRNGRTIKVPAVARGARLESGDEIVLGHAPASGHVRLRAPGPDDPGLACLSDL